MRIALILSAFATSAAADYSEHSARRAFDSGPCTAFVAAIDTTLDGMVEGFNETEWQMFGQAAARQGMYWGILLGYDAAKGGLHQGDKTTLARLRLGAR